MGISPGASPLRRNSPKLTPDGVIAGHDYTTGNWVKGYRYGVVEAVHEFCVEEDWELIYITAEPIENQSFAIRRMSPLARSAGTLLQGR